MSFSLGWHLLKPREEGMMGGIVHTDHLKKELFCLLHRFARNHEDHAKHFHTDPRKLIAIRKYKH